MISVVILAAGMATRMGGDKLALKLQGASLLQRAVAAATGSKAGEVVLVLGHHAESLGDELRQTARLKIVVNPDYRLGMSASLKAGIKSVAPEANAAIVTLADQPLVDSAILDLLIDKYDKTRAAIVAPSYGGRQGNPVLFDRSLFPELLQVSGDVGGREVVARHRQRIALVPIAAAEADRDVDTWEDYRTLAEGDSGRGSSSAVS